MRFPCHKSNRSKRLLVFSIQNGLQNYIFACNSLVLSSIWDNYKRSFLLWFYTIVRIHAIAVPQFAKIEQLWSHQIGQCEYFQTAIPSIKMTQIPDTKIIHCFFVNNESLRFFKTHFNGQNWGDIFERRFVSKKIKSSEIRDFHFCKSEALFYKCK